MYGLKQNSDILWVLVQKELTVRYKNSLIGFLWSILHPVILSVIYYFAFKIVIRVKAANYALFLMSGLFLWQWFQGSFLTSLNSFFNNRPLVKKLPFDRYLLPMSSVLAGMIHLIASLPALIILMLVFHIPFTAQIMFLPLILADCFILVFAVSLVFSIMNVFFRDFERIMNIMLQVIFYATPIVYTADMIPRRFKIIMLLNPLSPMFESWRTIFLGGNVDCFFILCSLASTLFLLSCALLFYKKYIHLIAERL
jgi:lipopolysaccharide transport system permease protein